jgi:diguanylate cyclase (GGDEF)-like protein
MYLDGPTLMAAGSAVAVIAAMMLFGAWTQMRAASALIWWVAADVALAVGIGALALGSARANVPVLAAGLVIANLGYGLIWAGIRKFHRRPPVSLPTFLLVAAGAAVFWFLLRHNPDDAIKGAGLAVTTGFLLAGVWELWRGRGERLQARLGFIGLVLMHAFITLGGLSELLAGRFPRTAAPSLNSWFGLIQFEGLIFLMGTAIFMLLLCRERIEHRLIEAARRDGVTGLASRGTFFDNAQRLLQRCQRMGTPLSLILFDLDRFKEINDTFGHQVGDRVLVEFANTCRRTLRPIDFAGRYGGEEFAVVLPGTTVKAAYVIADRTRHVFAEAGLFVDERTITATVSAGVATAGPGVSFDQLIEAADAALYRAKNAGRNCVQMADVGDEREATNVIRVA